MLKDILTALNPYLGYFGEHSWVQACVVIVASMIVGWIFNRFIITTLRRLAEKTAIKFDNHLIDYLQRPIYVSVLLLGIALAVKILNYGDSFDYIIYSFLLSVAFLVWSLFLIKFVRMILRHAAQSDQHLPVIHQKTLPLFENLANITIFVVAVYVIFSAWDIDMTAWLASAGIVGIAVGFAAKDTLANLFSGVFILADAPYKIGDYVVLDSGERGEVTHIGIRSTRMLTRDDVEVTVPNSVMGNTKIINESGGPHQKYRIRIPIGVAYGSDIDQVRQVLMEIAESHEDICAVPEPRVRMRQFGASSLDFELLGWIDEPVLRGRVIDSLNCEIYKSFIKEGIEIPYSKHDLYIKEMPSS